MRSPSNGNEIRAGMHVPAAVAWEILTCREGARLWLADEWRNGVEVGTTVTVRGVGLGEVVAVLAPERIELRLPDGTGARIEVRPTNAGRSEIVLIREGITADPAIGWSHLVESAAVLVDRARDYRRPRQAVVVVHGIGSQRPLATMRRFTDALVDRDERWSKPDRLSSSFELRRHQLRRTRRRPRTDVYELYWADKVPGTALGHITRWLASQARRPADTSPGLRPLLYLCLGAFVIAVVALAVLLLTIGVDGVGDLREAATGIAGVSLLTGLLSGWLIKSVGDAARYLDDHPDNVAVRQSIREAGIDLLRRLHGEEGYHRVVLVGHSLGSVIAYDLIRHYWGETHREHGWAVSPKQERLDAYLAAAGAPTREQQRDLWRENRGLGMPWLITDLVTLGSPLAHATSILARSRADLAERRRDLELPTCPPQLEQGDLTIASSYAVDGLRRTVRVLDQGCPFAVTRWTNLYSPAGWGLFGDLVGGPVTELGDGIENVEVRIDPWWRRWSLLAHAAYWRANSDAASKLADAIGVESTRWLGAHAAGLPWTDTLRANASELREHIAS
jgi:hypothetical protein